MVHIMLGWGICTWCAVPGFCLCCNVRVVSHCCEIMLSCQSLVIIYIWCVPAFYFAVSFFLFTSKPDVDFNVNRSILAYYSHLFPCSVSLLSFSLFAGYFSGAPVIQVHAFSAADYSNVACSVYLSAIFSLAALHVSY